MLLKLDLSFHGNMVIPNIAIGTSLPYFRVKLNCVCLMFAYRKKVMIYSDPMVTYSRVAQIKKVVVLMAYFLLSDH